MEPTKEKEEFKSRLEKPIQRAMSGWLHFALAGKIISFADFIGHFEIMKVITSVSAEVRGKVLCVCNGGGDAGRAAKMKAEIVGNTIASMLDDKLVTPEDVCREITTDHMVEVLSAQELYRLVFGNPEEKKRWLHEGKKQAASLAFMVAVHRVIHAENLLGAANYVKALGEVKFIHEKTPPQLLAAGQRDMLAKNREGKVFTDDDLIKVYAPNELINYVDLADLFAPIEAVARANVWVEEPKPAEAAPAEPAKPAEAVEEAEPLSDRATNRPPPSDDTPDIQLSDVGEASSTAAKSKDGGLFSEVSGDQPANADPREVSSAVGKHPAMVDDLVDAIRTDNKPGFDEEHDSERTRIMPTPPRPIVPGSARGRGAPPPLKSGPK